MSDLQTPFNDELLHSSRVAMEKVSFYNQSDELEFLSERQQFKNGGVPVFPVGKLCR
jgi:hypothetical protein